MCRSLSGSATHSCTPRSVGGGSAGEVSACAMPRPAVIRLSCPGTHELVAADAVLVVHLALEQPGHRLQTRVRMRRHMHARRPATSVGP